VRQAYFIKRALSGVEGKTYKAEISAAFLEDRIRAQ
jgi:hypothetical protein